MRRACRARTPRRRAPPRRRGRECRRPLGSVFDALTGHPGIEAVDRSATEFLVEEALLSLLDRSAANSPVALVIDDLQWADPATIAFVSRLARLVPQLGLLL